MVSQDDSSALGKAHVPLGEDGSGLYSAATLGCFSVIENATSMVLKSIEKASGMRKLVRKKRAWGSSSAIWPTADAKRRRCAQYSTL